MIEHPGRKPPFIERLLLVAAASLAVTSFARISALPPPHPVFEVATVKQNKSGSSGGSSTFENGRFIATNALLTKLIQYQAYRITERQIVGGPKWLNTERFDIEAKTNSLVADQLRTLSRDQRTLQTQGMFQRFLADSFKLVVHWETRDLPVYALVVAKKPPIFHEWKESDGGPGTEASTGKFSANGVTMADLVWSLTQELLREFGRIVVDNTGIKGRYNVTLKWTPETDSAPVSIGTDGTAPLPDSGASIFTALQEQLGLKLKATKGPVGVLVIDHVEMPSAN
ncbi:MAG TPA: TIGR03435 family protein [Bryobacteraceae bacterium]|jgi:uncharacterized protein (TIGR03435 family)